MTTVRLVLIVPSGLVTQPLIYTACKTHRLVPNIRKARITETSGEAVLDLSGDDADLQAGIGYLTGLGVQVKSIPA
jgi:hypothetical protein